MTREFRRILITAASVLIGAAAAQADTVTLRSSVRLGQGTPITLGAIAALDGPDATALAKTVVVADAGARAAGRAFFEVPIVDVRAALEAQGVNWGRVSLRGGVCVVRFAGATAEPEHAPPRATRRPEPTPTTVDLTGAPTVRTRVAQLLARVYSVAPTDLRVRFDADDEAFLSIPEAGRRIEVQPAATPGSSRFSAIVWVYAGDHLIDSRTLRLDIRVRRSVVVLSRPLDRGDAITPDTARAQTMWVEPIGAPMASSIESVAGSVARRRLRAGAILRTDQLESPVVVRRGELITVHCVSGGVVVKAKARAQKDAREGERIELRMDGSKKSFTARVVGPGRAVVNLDDHPEPSLPEPTRPAPGRPEPNRPAPDKEQS